MSQFQIDLLRDSYATADNGMAIAQILIAILFTVVIAMIVFAILWQKTRKTKITNTFPNQVIHCPFCGKQNNIGTHFCGNCGQAINPSQNNQWG